MNDEKKSEIENDKETIELHRNQLRALASELALSEERQRRAIASDLHDHIGQALAMIKLKVQQLQGDNVFSPLYTQLGEVKTLVEQTISYTRNLTGELSPPVLYELGLESAIKWLAERTSKNHKLKINVKSKVKTISLHDDIKITIFRAVNELLINTVKHSKADYVLITMENVDKDLVITINDNGIGFDPAILDTTNIKKTSYGLFSIREKLHYLDINLKIETKPGAGTKAIISLKV